MSVVFQGFWSRFALTEATQSGSDGIPSRILAGFGTRETTTYGLVKRLGGETLGFRLPKSRHLSLGECYPLNSESNSKSPLAGLTVMVTRPELQAHSLAESLRELGADVLIEPVIEIQPPPEWNDLDRAIQETVEGRVSTLVFVSVNGVRAFVDRFAQLAQAEKQDGAFELGEVRVLGIGKATCDALADRDIESAAVPGKSDSNSVADFLISNFVEGGTLIVRADRGQ